MILIDLLNYELKVKTSIISILFHIEGKINI